MCVPVSNQSRISPVVKGESQANRRSGGRFLGAAVSTPRWPAPSHNILDGQ